MGLRAKASHLGLSGASNLLHRRIHRSAIKAGYAREVVAATIKVMSVGMPIMGLGLAAAYLLLDNPDEGRS